MLTFDWDPAKRRSNLSKHKIDFRAGEPVFRGPNVSFIDDRFDYDEEREIAIGMIGVEIVVVVYTNTHWIISARKANEHEANLFFQTIDEGSV